MTQKDSDVPVPKIWCQIEILWYNEPMKILNLDFQFTQQIVHYIQGV